MLCFKETKTNSLLKYYQRARTRYLKKERKNERELKKCSWQFFISLFLFYFAVKFLYSYFSKIFMFMSLDVWIRFCMCTWYDCFFICCVFTTFLPICLIIYLTFTFSFLLAAVSYKFSNKFIYKLLYFFFLGL